MVAHTEQEARNVAQKILAFGMQNLSDRDKEIANSWKNQSGSIGNAMRYAIENAGKGK